MHFQLKVMFAQLAKHTIK